MTRTKLVRNRRLTYSISVTQHPLLLLLLQPLMIGVVKPIHNPKQTPSLPPTVTSTNTLLIVIGGGLVLIAVVCTAVAPGSPVVLCHITFTVYVAAVYVRNR